jgi:hypothetical protein
MTDRIFSWTESCFLIVVVMGEKETAGGSVVALEMAWLVVIVSWIVVVVARFIETGLVTGYAVTSGAVIDGKWIGCWLIGRCCWLDSIGLKYELLEDTG